MHPASYNRRDVDFALEQFSEDIFFQDMMFPEPIRGKAELREHFDRSVALLLLKISGMEILQ